MNIKNGIKSGAATTEVVIGITLSIIVLFVALGLFNDNLAEMATSSNLSNVYNAKNKTLYSSFNRDYSDTQINVQIMGEQGLTLRKTANNKAITQIGDYLSGSDKSATNANSIIYLVLAIKSIVGQPDVCIYLKKETDKFCDEDNIGGYSYKIKTGSALTIRKVNASGDTTLEQITLTPTSTTSGIFTNANSTIHTNSDQRSAFTPNERYKFIEDLSTKSEPYVYPHVLLVRILHTFTTSPTKVPNYTKSTANALIDLLSALRTSTKKVYDVCGCTKSFGCPFCRGPVINYDDLQDIKHWLNQMEISISAAGNNSNKSAEDVAALFSGNLSAKILGILGDDQADKKHKVSCEVLIDELLKISDKSNLSPADFGITETATSYVLRKGGNSCTAKK